MLCGAPTRRYESVKTLDGLEMSVLQGQDAGSGGADIVMVCLLPMLDLSVNGPEACRDGHRATLTVRYAGTAVGEYRSWQAWRSHCRVLFAAGMR